jgi:hypothetical protein
MSDIVERLRALVIIDEVRSDNQLGKEAADEIVRLNGIAMDLQTLCDKQAMEIGRLRAERDRLRDALPELSSVITWLRNGCSPTDAARELEIYKTRIDAALKGDTT